MLCSEGVSQATGQVAKLLLCWRVSSGAPPGRRQAGTRQHHCPTCPPHPTPPHPLAPALAGGRGRSTPLPMPAHRPPPRPPAAPRVPMSCRAGLVHDLRTWLAYWDDIHLRGLTPPESKVRPPAGWRVSAPALACACAVQRPRPLDPGHLARAAAPGQLGLLTGTAGPADPGPLGLLTGTAGPADRDRWAC